MAIDDNALCTLDDVKLYLDITGDTDDVSDLLEVLINQVTKQIETYCGTTFDETTYTEYYDGNNSQVLFPDHYPITSVSGIWNDASWEWPASSEIASTGYRIADNNRIVFYSSTIGTGVQNVKITYTAGYSSIPKDLALVCVKEVARLFRTRDDKGASFKRGELPTGSYDNAYIIDEFLPESVAVLNRYRIKGAL